MSTNYPVAQASLPVRRRLFSAWLVLPLIFVVALLPGVPPVRGAAADYLAPGVERLGHILGNYQMVTGAGLVYIFDSTFFSVFDVRDPQRPATVLEETRSVSQVFPAGALTYVVAGGAVAALDVADPGAPRWRGSYSFDGGARITGIEAARVYLMRQRNLLNGSSEIAIDVVDWRDRDHPLRLGSYSVFGGSSDYLTGISAIPRDGILYFSYGNSWQGFCIILDMRDPARPTLLGTISGYGYIGFDKIVGATLYVSVSYRPFSHTFEIYDITDPAHPVRLSQFVLRRGLTVPSYEIATEIVDSRIYLRENDTLYLLDLSNLRQPTLRGSYTLPGLKQAWSAGALVYLTAEPPGAAYSLFEIVDFSLPDSPVRRGSLILPRSASAIQVVGSYAYIYGGETVAIVDVSNPDQPLHAGGIELPYVNLPLALQVASNLLYVLDADGLRIFDVATPARPRLRSTLARPASVAIQLEGQTLYLLNKELGLQMLDVRDPAQPQVLGSYGGVTCCALAVDQQMAYITEPAQGLQIIDASDPHSPGVRGSLPAIGAERIGAPTVANGMVYVLFLYQGPMLVIDVSDPDQPRRRGTYTPARGTGSVQVQGGLAYLGVDSTTYDLPTGSLDIVDISDPDRPALVSQYLTHRGVAQLQVTDHRAYLLTNDGGMTILDVSNATKPRRLGPVSIPWGGSINPAGDTIYKAKGAGGIDFIRLHLDQMGNEIILPLVQR